MAITNLARLVRAYFKCLLHSHGVGFTEASTMKCGIDLQIDLFKSCGDLTKYNQNFSPFIFLTNTVIV